MCCRAHSLITWCPTVGWGDTSCDPVSVLSVSHVTCPAAFPRKGRFCILCSLHPSLRTVTAVPVPCELEPIRAQGEVQRGALLGKEIRVGGESRRCTCVTGPLGTQPGEQRRGAGWWPSSQGASQAGDRGGSCTDAGQHCQARCRWRVWPSPAPLLWTSGFDPFLCNYWKFFCAENRGAEMVHACGAGLPGSAVQRRALPWPVQRELAHLLCYPVFHPLLMTSTDPECQWQRGPEAVQVLKCTVDAQVWRWRWAFISALGSLYPCLSDRRPWIGPTGRRHRSVFVSWLNGPSAEMVIRFAGHYSLMGSIYCNLVTQPQNW